MATYARSMGLFSLPARRRSSRSGGGAGYRVSSASARAETLEHFRQFQASRTGVEAYIEPATRVDPTTMVLVARTGEWTRRRVPDTRAARKLARELHLPVDVVQLTGYPARMREWTAKQRPGRPGPSLG
mgnify:CR=1 FL=1